MKKLPAIFILFLIYFGISQQACSQTPAIKQTKEELISNYSQDDSSKAIINLFYRKRKGANLRGMIGGGFAGYSAGSAIGSGDFGNAFIGPLLFSPLIITSITQNAKYKQTTLLQLLDQHKNGSPFPHKFNKKLKSKDFGK